ncbi:conserved hypothetical protein [Burkholderia vietnamiensis]|nr:conserved hypothetical protein [Burkholderia vietnamiensis]
MSGGAAASCRQLSAAQRASASQDVGSHDDLTVYRAFRLAPEPKRAQPFITRQNVMKWKAL